MSELWQPLNVNHTVRVKLTDIGRARLREIHERYRALYPSFGEYKEPAADQDGYSEFQLWSLMQDLGPFIAMGVQVPFETEILVKVPAHD